MINQGQKFVFEAIFAAAAFAPNSSVKHSAIATLYRAVTNLPQSGQKLFRKLLNKQWKEQGYRWKQKSVWLARKAQFVMVKGGKTVRLLTQRESLKHCKGDGLPDRFRHHFL